MLKYFNTSTPAPKKNDSEKKFIADEKLIHYSDYIELDNKLQLAKDRIQELEANLETKEQLHNELHQKIHLLTTNIEQEKSTALEQQLQFSQEEDALTNEIASLKVDILKQESDYEHLRKKIIDFQAQQEAQLALQEQYKQLQTKMDEKEREYEILVNKIADLESANKQIEERLIKEKNEHKETKSALALEKNARQSSQPPCAATKKIETVALPGLANNSTTLFNHTLRRDDHRENPFFSEHWSLFSGY